MHLAMSLHAQLADYFSKKLQTFVGFTLTKHFHADVAPVVQCYHCFACASMFQPGLSASGYVPVFTRFAVCNAQGHTVCPAKLCLYMDAPARHSYMSRRSPILLSAVHEARSASRRLRCWLCQQRVKPMTKDVQLQLMFGVLVAFCLRSALGQCCLMLKPSLASSTSWPQRRDR